MSEQKQLSQDAQFQKELALDCQEIFKQTGKFPTKKMEALWKTIIPFVEKISWKKSIRMNNQTQGDLRSVSYEAMCAAVRLYDPKKMDNFFTYCVKWIVAYVRAENTRNLSLFRFGSRKDRKLFNRISKVSHLPLDEQARVLGVSDSELAEFMCAVKMPKSLLKKRVDDSASEQESEEYLTADTPNPETLLNFKNTFESVKTVFNSFEKELMENGSKIEKEVFNLLRRVGVTEKGNFKKESIDDLEKELEEAKSLNNENKIAFIENALKEANLPQTYADIAVDCGVSRERVRQVSNKVRDTLRYRLIKNNISDKAYHAFI